MEYRTLGRTGIRVSAVSYGGIVSAGRYDGAEYPQLGQEASDRFVSWAVDRGVDYFDVAPAYGDAEEQLGRSLEPYRSRVYLACKTEKRDRASAQEDLARSLKRLRTDHFDVYQLHAVSSMEDVERAFAPGGVMELMRDAKEKGIATHIGFTAHSEDAALKMLELYDFETVLFPLNWFMHMEHGMGARLVRAAKEKGVGLLAMKAFIERRWDSDAERRASATPKSWCRPIDADGDRELLLAALKYVVRLGVDTIVPPGNFDHFRFAVEHIGQALSEPMTEREEALLAGRLVEVADRPFFGPDCYGA